MEATGLRKINDMMKAILIDSETTPPQLIWGDAPDMTYGSDEVLVAVKATAVNRADLMQAAGNYPPPAGTSPILGLEMAGVITAVGSAVTDWAVGDRVCALLSGGGYAEYAAVPAAMLIPLPDDWTFVMGAALPEVWLTAFVNLFNEAALQPGEAVLLHAGGSGVGTAAIQLAKAAGATVYTTSSAAKLPICLQLGADMAINRHTQRFDDEILAVSDGVDVVIDPVGADYLEMNTRVLRPFGRLIHLSMLSGHLGTLNIAHVMRKRLTLIGSTLRSRPSAEKAAITRQFITRFWGGFASGQLRPIIDTTYPIAEAQAAHAYISANRNVGKVILHIAD